MSVSQETLQSILASASKKVLLQCVTIEHSSITTRRLVNNTEDLPRTVGTYERFSFKIKGIASSAERPPGISIQFTMVDQRVMDIVRSIAGLREKPVITYEVVQADNPDTLEYGPIVFQYSGANSDQATKVELQASFLPGALNDAFPAGQFGPSNVQ